MQGKQYEGQQTAQANTNQVRNPFKRQLTDKYSAEKINAIKESRLGGGAGSRVDSAENDKTRLSFPSDLSQAAANVQQTKNTGAFQGFRRSGTQKEQKERDA